MLKSPQLSRLAGIRHAFFTRQGGVSSGLYAGLNGGLGSGDNPAHVGENRRRMAKALGVAPDLFLSVFQIHSPDVVVVSSPWSSGSRPRADAMVTKTPGVSLGVTTADCGPVLLADPEAKVIGAAHAGWKGALTGILENTVAAMEALGARRSDIVVALGPMIRQPNYEVGSEFVARFTKAAPENGRFFRPAERDGHAMFDLAAYIGSRLKGAGVTAIDDIGACTYADETRFYSYRRSVHRNEPDYGRHVHAISLSDPPAA